MRYNVLFFSNFWAEIGGLFATVALICVSDAAMFLVEFKFRFTFKYCRFDSLDWLEIKFCALDVA